MYKGQARAVSRTAIAAGALAALLLACALMLAHVRQPVQGMALNAPQAASRKGERMTVARPIGAVSVNRASADELQAIRGVGEVTAQRIVQEREQNGVFAYVEDLLNVRGIGEKTLQKLLPQINLDE
ncbi:MAG: ComEA family DNA-binding protein [Clostridia bacterium]